jgi:ATP-dependent exoDNAse (exonuclease V) beta subunit
LLQESLGNPCFEAGIKLPKVSESTGKKEQSISLSQYPSYAYVNHLRLRYADDKETEETATSLRDYGILMHRAFSEIFTTDDVDKAIDSLVLQGFIANDKQMLAELRQNITEALKQPDAAPWFDGSWNVHAEADILLPHTGEPLHRLRPDRVMTGHGKVVVVDYKFGENEQEVYEGQVKRYISCLKSMGYEKVEGYLWYVGKKKVIPIIF